MAYEIAWLVPKRVIIVRYAGHLTLREIQLCTEQGLRMLDAGTAPVHTLFDCSQLEKYPARISDIYSAAPQERHPNSGMTIFYGLRQSILTTIVSILSQLAGFPYRIVASRDEAMAVLVELNIEVSDGVKQPGIGTPNR